MRIRTNKEVHEGWATFLRVTARNSKLKFVIGKNVGPATDGKTIFLPALPAELNRDDLVMFKGNAIHEVGHILHSNIKFFQAFSKEHGSFASSLLNALDDVFMEREQVRFSRMAEKYLRGSAKIMAERKQFRDGSSSAGEAVFSYCLCYLFSRNWSEYVAPLQVIQANFNVHFGEHAEGLLQNLNMILDSEFAAVKSTDDAGTLALRIIAMLKEQSQHEEDKKEPEEENGKPDDKGQDPSQNGAENGSGEPDDSQGKNKSESKDSGGDGGDSESSSKGEPQSGEGNGGNADTNTAGKGEPTSEPGKGDEGQGGNGKSLNEIVEEMLKADVGDGEVFDKSKAMEELSNEIARGQKPGYEGKEIVSNLEIGGDLNAPSSLPAQEGAAQGAGKPAQLVDGMVVCKSDRQVAAVLLKLIDRKANVLAARLGSLLSNREEAEMFAARRGRLGDNNLYRLGLGDTRVFEQKEEVELPTAAVSVTADLSGSTQGECAMAIQQSLLLLEKVLEQLGTPREMFGFAPASGQLNTVIRTFGDNHQTAIDRIGGLSSSVGGGHTPIGEAVFQACIRLQAHESQKKVLFVLTDGAPSDVAKAIEMTSLAQRGGVKVVYLLIGEAVQSDWLKKAGIPFAKATTAGDLCPILLEKVGELLG